MRKFSRGLFCLFRRQDMWHENATLPKTNMDLRMGPGKTVFLYRLVVFRVYVRFARGNIHA